MQARHSSTWWGARVLGGARGAEEELRARGQVWSTGVIICIHYRKHANFKPKLMEVSRQMIAIFG
jgi:hypothetical protein